MRIFKNHIFLTAIAVFSTNIYFVMYLWLIPVNAINPVVKGLIFSEFLVVTNLSLLIISVFAVMYNTYRKYLISNNLSSVMRFIITTGTTVFIFIGVNLIFYFIHYVLFKNYPLQEVGIALKNALLNKYFTSLTMFFMLTCMLMFFVSNLERRSETIAHFISQSMGEILKPKLVDRGFIFIDLNQATTLAEKLGSTKYAMLLRDCFRLLNELITFEDFQVYQYVGDEVVLTWEAGLEQGDLKAINLFMDFKFYLIENSHHFITEYDEIPWFKCAIHSGEVVKSEIGKNYKHLVYHGDTLNTTSRMLGECHELGTDLLISRPVIKNLNKIQEIYTLNLVEKMQFKGKISTIDAYIVSEKFLDGEKKPNQIWNPFLPKSIIWDDT